MRMLRRCAPVIGALVLALSTGQAESQSGERAAEASALPRAVPGAVGLASASLSDATALLKRFVAERKIAGAVAAVARHGKLAYLESVGVQDLDSRSPMTERSRRLLGGRHCSKAPWASCPLSQTICDSVRCC